MIGIISVNFGRTYSRVQWGMFSTYPDPKHHPKTKMNPGEDVRPCPRSRSTLAKCEAGHTP